MAEIASAAGFGSIRRFNEIFQQLYRRPPKALRRTGITDDPSQPRARLPSSWATDHPTTGMPSCRFFVSAQSRASNWCRATDIHARSRSAMHVVYWSSNPPTKLPQGNRPSRQISRPCRRSSHASAACSILQPILWRSALISAETLRWRHLSPLVRAFGFLVRGTDSNSPCVPSLGSRSRVSAATRLAGKLVAAYGEKIVDPAAFDQGLTHVFPTARQLAGSDLAAIGMPQARRLALASLAAAVVADPLIFGPRRSLETCRRTVAIAAGDRRMDRPIYRHARTARARCLSGRRYRSAASDA